MKKYVFLCKKTGKPLTLHIESNPPDAECCGDTTVTLDAPHPDRALFAVNTLQEAIEARAFDVGWYNSTATQPCHGDYKPEDIDIAEMEVVFKKVSFKGPLVIAGTDIYDSRDIPWVMAKRIEGMPTLENKGRFVIVLLRHACKLAPSELREHIGEEVYFGDRYNRRELLGVTQAREEWQEFGDIELICRSGY